MPLGIADVHAGQVGGEQRRLLAALAGLHLEQDVVGVMRIARGEQVGQLGVELGDGLVELVDLGGERSSSAASSRAASRSPRAVSSLRWVATIGASCANRRPALRALSASAVQFGIGQLALEVGVLGEHGVDRRHGVRHVDLLSPLHTPAAFPKHEPTPGLRVARQFGRRKGS